MLRRSVGWALRWGGQTVIGAMLRLGRRSAVNSALGTAAKVMPTTSRRSHTQVFTVDPTVTLYVRASHCRLIVCCHAAPTVLVAADLYRAFGIELTAEQDDAGVYIVAKRKAIVGKIARIDIKLIVPVESHLALHLTPGDVIFQDIDGMITLPTQHMCASTKSPAISH